MKQQLLLIQTLLRSLRDPGQYRFKKQKLLSLGLMWLTVTGIMSCEIDDFTETVPDGENNGAPTLTVNSPAENTIIKAFEENEFTASFADSDIGLSQATVTVKTEEGKTALEESFRLIGTTDDIKYTIKKDTLAAGNYIVSFTVSDTQGKGTTIDRNFTARAPFSQQPQMNIAGTFNGWSNSDNPMHLIDDYRWATEDSITLTAPDEFLFIADPSFDPKFTDSDCNMVAELGGTGNIVCQYAGTFAVYFNDQTLEYSLEGMVVLASNNDEMYVLGSMNGWGGTDLQMTLVDDYTWQVEEVSITPTDEFKFANTSNFADEDWTDDGCDGLAAPGVGLPNIACGFDGVFTITFNDQTLEYSVEVPSTFASNQDEMYVLGSMNGWGGTDLEMTLIDDYTWEVTDVALVSTSEFKFANTSNFSDTDWGDDGCDGVASDPEDNINKGTPCNWADGNYTITFNDNTLEYSVELQ